MNAYHRFLLSQLIEFRRKAQPHIPSPCAQLMGLEGATNEDACSVVLHQTLRRIRLLGRVAGAANARVVQAFCQTLESRLVDLMHAQAAARPKSFDAIQQTMNELVNAWHAIDSETSSSEHDCQGTETALAGACAN